MGLLKGFSSGSVLFPSQITNTVAKAKTSLTKQVNSKNPNKKAQPKKSGPSPRKGSGSLRYPLEYMGVNRDYLQIKIYEWITGKPKFDTGITIETDNKTKQIVSAKFTGVPKIDEFSGAFNKATSGKNGKKAHTFVSLPMPAMISDGTSVTWGEDTINPVEMAAVTGGAMTITNPGATRDIVNKIISGEMQLNGITDPKIKNKIALWMAGKAVNAAGSNISPMSLITRTTGKVLQQNLELLLSGPNLRQFTFVWNFSPRDSSEASEVKAIIRAFKKYMAVRGGPGNEAFFIGSPDVFDLTYMHRGRQHPFLNTFKPAVLSNMDLNYTASGQYSTYNDGTPVHISMSCVFREINPIYSEDYDDGGVGVGY